MPTLSLTPTQQEALLQAHLALDGYDVVQGDKVVRVAYRLGPERRTAVKNINILRKSLGIWNEIRMAIVREYYPNKPDHEEADKDADPKIWREFSIHLAAAMTKPDELDLLRFSAQVMYENGELPIAALTVLDEHDLIEV